MKKITLSFVAAVTLASTNFAFDVIAINPVKPEAAICGDNQVLYIISTEDLSVKKRISLDFDSDGFDEYFTYTNDGKYLLFNSFMEDFNLFETENYTVKTRFEVLDHTFSDVQKTKLISVDDGEGIIQVFEISNGQTSAQLNFPALEYGQYVSACFNSTKNEILFWIESKESKEDKKSFSYSELTDLSVVERIKKERMNDGETSEFFTVNLTTKKISEHKTSWMSDMHELFIFPYNDEYYCVDDEVIFKVTATGETEIVHGFERSVSHSVFIPQSNTICSVSDGGVTFFDIASNQASFYKITLNMGFTKMVDFANDWAYFVTTNYRCAGMSLTGGMKRPTHVF